MYFKNFIHYMAEPTTITTVPSSPEMATPHVKLEPTWNDLLPFGGLFPMPPPPPGSMYSPERLDEEDDFLLKQELHNELNGVHWNPALHPLPPPGVGPYHPMLMMKMMMMNMEHKAGVPPAGSPLGPMVNPGLFARLNQMATEAAAVSAMQQSSSPQPEMELPLDKQVDSPKPATNKPKRVRKPRPPNPNGGGGRSRNKAVSANRRLVQSTVLPSPDDPSAGPKMGPNPIYRCHLCPYTGNSKLHFNAHMNTHFDHRCPHCDYTSRTEGRLKRHIRDFHSETPPETWSGNRVRDPDDPTPDDGALSGDEANCGTDGPNPARNRKYRCKQCNYVAIQKHDYWEHTKQHIKTDKMLNCPKCNFVTEFKHHLVYHLRNHFGSKPFKCGKCNYSCVNKSMLNSHMKSHSNIYQYRCEDCTYATKYCHSLKLHLRKYGHRPATVLNLDGTPNPYPVIDVYGTRRGPRPKKGAASHCGQASAGSEGDLDGDEEMLTDEMEMQSKPQNLSSSASSFSDNGSEPNGPFTPPPQLTPLVKPETPSTSSTTPKSANSTSPVGANFLKCDYCTFQTECKQDFSNHLLDHVMHEKQTLVNIRAKAASKPKQQPQPLLTASLEAAPPGSSASTPPPTPLSNSSRKSTPPLFAPKFDLPPLEPIHAPPMHTFPPFLPFSQSIDGSFHFGHHGLPGASAAFHQQPTFTCGELTPPTPTIEEPTDSMLPHSMTPFKPLDLSGKHNGNANVNQPQMVQQPMMLCNESGVQLLANPATAGANPMTLLLMNSILLNAQRNLKDVLESSSGDSNQSGSQQEQAKMAEEVEQPIVHHARPQKRKGRANRVDLEKLKQMMSDEELEKEEEEEEGKRSSQSVKEVETGANYFELLKSSQMKLTGQLELAESEHEDQDNDEMEERPVFRQHLHQLPPTPTKSPNKGSIFDFTDDSQQSAMERSDAGDIAIESPLEPPSPPLAPAILQLLAQLLQLNPNLNPTMLLQQILPQLLLEGNCNLAGVTTLLSKVYSATLQELLLEMVIKK